MTGIEKIKAKILEDANAKAGEIQKQAEKEAGDIIARASKEAEDKKTGLLKKAESEGAELYRRRLSVARLEGRKEILRARQDMLDKAFKAAMERIVQLPDAEYQKIIEDMAVDAAPERGGEILLSEKDAGRMDGRFISNINRRLADGGKKAVLTLSGENIRTAGGFVLRSGDMEVNSTFEILFGMLRPELENEAAAILFGG